MKTIAVVTLKGGSGKTTTAINLAIAAEQTGMATALIDLDPRQSSTNWAKLRGLPTPAILSGTPDTLPQLLKAAEDAKADLVVLDTQDSPDGVATAQLANFAVIPCQPTILDLDPTPNTTAMVAQFDTSHAVLLTRCISRSLETIYTAKTLEALGLQVLDTKCGSRVDYTRSLSRGQGAMEYKPHDEAAREIRQLFAEIMRQPSMTE